MNTITDIASKSLGSSASYAVYTDTFDSSLLNPMPRKLARDDWGIKGTEFVGMDVWHCHEATFLLDSGAPIAGTIKFAYSSDSDCMVESKSMKLYLNSFDMCKMGKTIQEAIINYEFQIKTDLERALNTLVSVKFFVSGADIVGQFPLLGYIDLFHFLGTDLESEKITDYSAGKNYIKFYKPDFRGSSSKGRDEIYINKFCTNVLRSRCRHTKQKDTGTAFISINTKNCLVQPMSLFKQIVSLREVNEFHEFCSEQLYAEIAKHPEVDSCVVTLMYARRGSLDINPTRATSVEMLPKYLVDTKYYTTKTMGQ